MSLIANRTETLTQHHLDTLTPQQVSIIAETAWRNVEQAQRFNNLNRSQAIDWVAEACNMTVEVVTALHKIGGHEFTNWLQQELDAE